MEDVTEIQFVITETCPLGCLHCSGDGRTHKSRGYAPSDASKIVRLFDNDVNVAFTGGEPLLSPDLVDFLHVISSNLSRISAGIYTSGIVINHGETAAISDSDARELRAAGLDYAYVSIYHSDPSLHDFIVSKPGCFDIAKQSIFALASAGIDVRIHLPLIKTNVMSLASILGELEELPVSEIRILRLVKIGRAAVNWESVGVSTDAQKGAIVKVLPTLRRVKLTISGFPDLFSCRPFPSSKGCQAGVTLYYINYEGNVFPCACKQANLGSMICHVSDTVTMKKYFTRTGSPHMQCLNTY